MTKQNVNITASEACERLSRLLSGRAWEVGDLDVVAGILREAGYEITDIDGDDTGASDDGSERPEGHRSNAIPDVDFTITFSNEAQTWMDIIDFLIEREYLVRISLDNGEEVDAIMRSFDEALTFDSWNEQTEQIVAHGLFVSVETLVAIHTY